MIQWTLVLIVWTGSASAVVIPMQTKEGCLAAGYGAVSSYEPNRGSRAGPRIDNWFCVNTLTGEIEP